MRKHRHQGPHATQPEPAHPSRRSRPRARSHPLSLVFGLLVVGILVAATAYTARSLYLDYTWRSTAQESAAIVARAIQSLSARDDSTPTPVDAVTAAPAGDQVPLSTLPYADEIPPDIARLRITDGGSLSVVTTTGALCSGVTLNMTEPGKRSSGRFACSDVLPPPAPVALRATPHDGSVGLEWPPSPIAVEDYRISYSFDDGTSWLPAADTVTATSRATVTGLANGRQYLFRVAAVNLMGESAPTTVSATPFTAPDPPTNVQAEGGFTAVVTWTAPRYDGGRPITGFVVTGDPTGTCTTGPAVTRCELADLPGSPAYTFTVRALNAAGGSVPSSPNPDPVAVFSVPDPPVALSAAPGDQLALLTWTEPLRDGNTPITDYLVDYRAVGADEWIPVPRPESTTTARAISGLTNGTEYEFQVRAVNAAGASDAPLSLATAVPATVPDQVPTLDAVDGNEFVTLTWTAPADDGDSPLTGYAVQVRSGGGAWRVVPNPGGTALTLDVTRLVNGTSYEFRVAAVNAMGQGPWSPLADGRPVGPPGPVVEPEAVGSLTAIELSWLPPENNGGRRLLGYRVEYKLSASPDWLALPRIPADETTVTVEDLEAGESYDFRIVAVNRVGAGPSTGAGPDRPTLAGVIADETPPAPKGLTATAGDGTVTLRWRAAPAGPDSPITAYEVTGEPSGTCTTKRLTCVVRGLTNGQTYSFTVTASNENVTGEASKPVSATPRVFNAATGGEVSTYTRGGRTYRVHTFYSSGTFTPSSATEPFSVLVVAGGAGSVVAADGTVTVGGGGGIIEATRVTLPTGPLAVVVGAGGPPGTAGGTSSLDGIGASPGGTPGTVDASPVAVSGISGTAVTYGGAGTASSGPGIDGRGMGGGGPTANRGGNGVVIIRYQVADAG